MKTFTLASIVVAVIIFVTTQQPARADSPITCAIGATAHARFCRYIVAYNKQRIVSPKIQAALGMGDGDTTRSIAIIAGVSQYPDAQEKTLKPAEIDINHLQEFLKRQGFDEIVVLREADVTFENLQYFFQTYLPMATKDFTKPRVLFAYSGHGVPASYPNTKGYLVLRGASDADDTPNLLSLKQLQGLLSQVAPKTFQFLALINSCYGGDIFGVVQGGQNVWETAKPGGSALTAGTPDELVYSLGGPNDGSLFFDMLIRGIESGDAAKATTITDASNRKVVRKRDVVRLGDLWSYINDSIGDLETPTKLYSKPWEGTVYDPPLLSYGGFFFISGQENPASFAFQAALPNGAVSGVPGHPELKVFNPPEEYEIRGIDVSEYVGDVDWMKVRKAHLPLGQAINFAYMRASEGADRTDKKFSQNWRGARIAEVVRGAYHVFDMCQPMDKQLANLTKSIGEVESNILPIGIDIEYYPKKNEDWFKNQSACFRSAGREVKAAELRGFISAIVRKFGKTPILFGNKNVVTDILQKDFLDVPLWLHDYDASGGTDLPGSNPWTFWQYTDKLHIDGVGASVDASVFFGSGAEFAAFLQNGGNVARDYALHPAEPQREIKK